MRNHSNSLFRPSKRVLTFLLAMTTGLTMVACGNNDTASFTPTETSSSQKSDEPVELTMWMGSWWEEQIPVIVEAYKEVAPNVSLNIEALPINGYVDKAVTTILGGDGPDILAVDVTQATTFMDKNLLMPLNEHIADMDLSDFSSIVNGCKQDDTYYGLPYRCSSSIMYYNKTMFDNANLAYPEDGWTYDDYLEFAKQLTIDGQQYGTGIAASKDDPSNVFMSYQPILWSFGANYLNDDHTVCTLNTPEAIEATTYWSELYTKHKVVPEGSINYTTTKDLVPLFIDGKVAMIMSGDQTAIELDTNHPDVEYSFVTPPKGPVGAGGWMLSVPVTAKNPDAAYDFINWFLQPEVLGELTIRIPARLEATQYGDWNTPLYQTIVKAAKNGRLAPTSPKWTDMQTIIITELQNIMQQAKTVEEACQDMTDQCNDLLQD